MIGALSSLYHLKAVDFLGTGLSSRPNFILTDPDHINDFFVDSLEKWRQAEKLDKFHIVGHSMGGYLATKYALKYPQHVQTLSLVSPAGVTKRDIAEIEKFTTELSWRKNGMSKFFYNLWQKKLTPQFIFTQWINEDWSKKLLYQYLKVRSTLPPEEVELFLQYFWNMLSMPESSDRGIFYLLGPPRLSGVRPLEEDIRQLKIPVDFYYGSSDWMDATGAQRLASAYGNQFRFFKISKAGHNINFDNPEELTELIIKNSRDTGK